MSKEPKQAYGEQTARGAREEWEEKKREQSDCPSPSREQREREERREEARRDDEARREPRANNW